MIVYSLMILENGGVKLDMEDYDLRLYSDMVTLFNHILEFEPSAIEIKDRIIEIMETSDPGEARVVENSEAQFVFHVEKHELNTIH